MSRFSFLSALTLLAGISLAAAAPAHASPASSAQLAQNNQSDNDKNNDGKDSRDRRPGQGSDQVARRTRDACRSEARDRNWDVVSTGTVQVNGRNGSMLMRLRKKDDERRADCRYNGEQRRASLSLRGGDGGGSGGSSGGGWGSGGGGGDRRMSEKEVREKCISEAYKKNPQSRFQNAGKVKMGSVSEMTLTFTNDGGAPIGMRCFVDQRTTAVTLRGGGN